LKYGISHNDLHRFYMTSFKNKSPVCVSINRAFAPFG